MGERIVDERTVAGNKSKLGGTIKELIRGEKLHLLIGHLELGERMKLHYHTVPEEVYYVLKGSGEMILGEKRLKLKPGLAIYIPPGMYHAPINTGKEPLIIAFFHAPPETGEYIVEKK
jgi:oxalate decarboxylase/phosphoglucose isomerase-like protein (cupin superfamily)